MAAGRVCTGFSLPYVALYSESSGTLSFSSAQKLARGVDVNIDPQTGDASTFYADNQAAESDGGKFTGGTVALTVDGLLPAAEKLIMGLPDASNDWTAYDDDQVVPYVAIGFIARYMSGGVTTYVPYILPKCIFNQVSNSANTQEENIDWQTQELTATILRADDAKHTWKWVGAPQSTEAAAEALITAKLA